MSSGRVDQECRQGYKGLRFGHIERSRLVYETGKKIKNVDGVDPIENIIFYCEIQFLDVNSYRPR